MNFSARGREQQADRWIHLVSYVLDWDVLPAGFLLSKVVKTAKARVNLRGYQNDKIRPDDDMKWKQKLGWAVAQVTSNLSSKARNTRCPVVTCGCCQVFGFLGLCQWMKAETRSLFNFFLSSFVNPMLRFLLPYVYFLPLSPVSTTR